jgi:hypothetical protein
MVAALEYSITAGGILTAAWLPTLTVFAVIVLLSIVAAPSRKGHDSSYESRARHEAFVDLASDRFRANAGIGGNGFGDISGTF